MRSRKFAKVQIQQFVQGFLDQRVRYEAQHEVAFILATPNADDLAIQTFEPATFNAFGKRRNFNTIGSGAQFVHRAISRDQQIGIVFNNADLSHLLVQIGYFAEAANESLTVDDKFLLGILANNRTYLMGDVNILPFYAPVELTQAWSQASTQFDTIRDLLKTVNGEAIQAQRVFSAIRTGTLSASSIMPILTSNTSIQNNLRTLSQLLSDYFVWYDKLLGRP